MKAFSKNRNFNPKRFFKPFLKNRLNVGKGIQNPKPNNPLRLSEKGMTLIELLIAIGILAAMTSSVMLARSFMAKQTVRVVQKGYATQKAIQMFEELRALVGGNEKLGVSVLDNYSDGSLYNTVLTTDKNIDKSPPGSGNPGDPVSGNTPINGHWMYLRQIQVNRLANDVNARQVIVKVWRYATDQKPNQPGELLATVGGMLRTIQSPFPPTQVLDLYVLDVQTIQAWWDVLPDLNAGMQGVIADLQLRNPGLQLRVHYITRSSFGRDSQYVPYINNAQGTDQAAMTWAYFYPGNCPRDAAVCGCEKPFFDPTNTGVVQCGGFNVDGTVNYPNTTFFAGCPSFAVCDQANQAMRYPDELALYQAVTNAWYTSNATSAMPDISERLLIDGMDSNPASFLNAMIINLHGELLPLPALRNYSDAAKDPGSRGTLQTTYGTNPNPSIYGTGSAQNFNDRYVRVVTHPELLYYPTAQSSVTVNLRVYAYYDGWQDTLGSLPANQQVPAISVFLPDYNSNSFNTSNVYGVTYIYGNSAVIYKADALSGAGGIWSPSGAVAGDTATMKLSYVGPAQQTLITLYNTDLRCPSGSNNTGLATADDLYGLEYIPCSPDNSTGPLPSNFSFTFGHGLDYSAGSGTPKNTARWIISLILPVNSTFPSAAGTVTVLGQTFAAPVTFPTILGQGGYNAHVIETRLGDGVTTSAVTLTGSGNPVINIPSNLSRTYVWLGNAYKPPLTEQFQMVGDPRHCPYLDCKVGGPQVAGAGAIIGPDAYNWYFKRGDNTAGVTSMYSDGYRGFDGAGSNSGWSGDQNEVDLPKYDMIIRNGLLKTTSIWTTLNGWSFYYFGLGGEFGFDHPPYTSSITIEQAPYLSATGAAGVNTNVTANELVNWSGAGTLNIKNERLVSLCSGSGSQGQDAWYTRYWMGELYPDSMANTWATYGNLPTVANTMAGEKFYHQDYANILGTNSLSGFRKTSKPGFIRETGGSPNSMGCSSFFLGGGSANNWFNHQGSGNLGSATTLAFNCYGIFTYDLPSEVSVQRPWKINYGTGNAPTESTFTPYSSMLNTLSIPSVTSNSGTSIISRIFYSSDQYTATNNFYGSGVVEIDNVSPGSALTGSTQKAYVLETGTSPSANVGTQDLTETALVETLRTFLDGGVMYSPGSLGHISQVPLVELWSTVVPQFSNPSSIPLVIDGAVTTGNPLVFSGFLTVGAGPTTNIWYRYPGTTSNTANFYTEEYPGYGSGVTASTYTESGVSLVYNLKYSYDDGKHWYFMQSSSATTPAPATLGVYSAAASYAVTGSLPITYSLQTPVANFPQGDYWMMVEAFRLNAATTAYMPLHYAYHILDLTINR